MAADDVQKLCEIEFSALNRRLQKRLKQDIKRIFTESLFCDLEVVLGRTVLKANNCILQVRTTTFYSHLCALQTKFPNGYELDCTLAAKIASLIGKIYETDDIQAAETHVVYNLKDVLISPDFEQYATPLTSPSEVFNKHYSLPPKSDLCPSYYSIVPLDWEKELAEQDLLFESFCSILQKEQSKNSVKPPSNQCSISSFNIFRDGDPKSLLDLKRAVEEDCVFLQEDCASYDNDCSHFNSIPQNVRLHPETVKCHFGSLFSSKESADSCQQRGFVLPESSLISLCNDSLSGMEKEITEKREMSSNCDTGPDSGLATSAEDIPLDQEVCLTVSKSISSSVSSDCCVSDSFSVPHYKDSNPWVDKAPHQDNSTVDVDFVNRVLEELVGKSQPHGQEQNASVTGECIEAGGVANTLKHNFFIDASSLLDETEIQQSTSKEEDDCENNTSSISQENIPCDAPYPVHNRIQEQQSLNERSELLKVLNGDPEVASNQSISNFGMHICNGDKGRGNSIPHSCLIDSNSFHKNQKEDKPPSLIRSNTFELKSENNQLTVLRQEYERRQGSLIFQKCVSQPSGAHSDGGSEDESSQHCTSLVLHDTGSTPGVANIPQLFTHMVEDEVQTPDSLNSDLTETAVQEKVCQEDSEFLSQGEELDCVHSSETDTIDGLPTALSSLTMNDISSPLFSRKKTESAPILSGAAPPLLSDNKPIEKKSRFRQTGQLSSAWVVDISDITSSPEARRRREGLSSASSTEHQSSDFKADQTIPECKSLSSSLGFFVDLKDRKPPIDNFDSVPLGTETKTSKQCSDSGRPGKQGACEFFVNLNHPPERNTCSPSLSDASHQDRKLFSMFIDIGGKVKPKAKPNLSSSRAPLSPFSTKQKALTPISTKQSDTINGSNQRESSISIIVNERTGKKAFLRSSTHLPAFTDSSDLKKGSVDVCIDSATSTKTFKGLPLMGSQSVKETINCKPRHVRAHSVSSLKNNMGSNTSIPSTLSTSSLHFSSLCLQNEVVSGEDNKVAFKEMLSSYHATLPTEESQIGVTKSEEVVAESELSSHITTCSNDSSACSLETYSVHTPEQSSTADNNSSERKNLFENFVAAKENGSHQAPGEVKWRHRSQPSISDKSSLKGITCTTETEDTPKTDNGVTKSFVRLSDLDKEPIGFSDQTTSSFSQRMSRSIPETSWIERKALISDSACVGSSILSSSTRSLSRLFPNMSMHSGSIGRSKNSSICSHLTEDLDTMRSSQVSDLSSMHSSAGLEYSTESTDISSDRGPLATQLGDDLLKMFLEEISTDVIVEVAGRRIKAHKCILSSRCQYFAAILSGGWVESAGNVISLQGFSYIVVHFALCHIYSGASTIPDQISIVELASLADMLSLEGLKDVIMYTLKVKYCHFFHKPCAVCSVGVLECLPLAAAYGLDDIYRKSLRWITKYFLRIWPTKTFTALPRELIDKCYQQHIIHMTPENVLETILCCEKLLSTIPTVRWAEPVIDLVSRLIETCIKFMSDNFCAVLGSDSFFSFGREVPWNVSQFQDSLVSACERMPPDQSCRSYSQLCSVLRVVQGQKPPPEMTWHPNFIELLIQLRDVSERTLIRQAPRAARTSGWSEMPSDLRHKIQDAACLVLVPAENTSSRYKRSTSDTMKQNSQRNSYSRSLDLNQVKMAMVQHARRSNSNEFHLASSVTIRKSIPPGRSKAETRQSAPVVNNKFAERPNLVTSQGRPKTWPAQVKSRYLETRPNHSKQSVESQGRNKQVDAPIPQRRVPVPVKGMFISSSDSSRNSSPAMKRSNNMSSNGRVGDSNPSSRSSKATSAGVCSSSGLSTTVNAKEEICPKDTDKATRCSLSLKAQSVSETLKIAPSARKSELIFHDNQSEKGGVNSKALLTVSTQPPNICTSNDSLATVSSCNDSTNPGNPGKNLKAEYSVDPKSNSPHHGSKDFAEKIVRPEITSSYTALNLSNKKVTSSRAPKKPFVISKTVDSNSSSLVSKRSISHITKSPVLSCSSSRLAIPLRTSRSVSSVPDKGYLKINHLSEGSSVPKSVIKSQSRSSFASGSSKLASSSNSSLAGKIVLSKQSISKNNDSKSGNYRNTNSVNGESSLDCVVHPSVGPRSGTFLKDEPTVLKTPVVDNS